MRRSLENYSVGEIQDKAEVLENKSTSREYANKILGTISPEDFLETDPENRMKFVTKPRITSEQLRSKQTDIVNFSFTYGTKFNRQLYLDITAGHVFPHEVEEVYDYRTNKTYTRVGLRGEFKAGDDRLKIKEGTKVKITKLRDPNMIERGALLVKGGAEVVTDTISDGIDTVTDFVTGDDNVFYFGDHERNKDNGFGSKTIDSSRKIELSKAKEEFISEAKRLGKEVELKYGVPWKVVCGQAALETGWGTSKSSKESHNYFGIKSFGKTSEKSYRTREVINGKSVYINDNFSTYSGMEESFMHYGEFLSKRKRYSKAFQYGLNGSKGYDPEKFINEVARAGYATDPAYASKVASTFKYFG